MGVLPLVFEDGQNAEKLGLTGREKFTILTPTELLPRQSIPVEVEREDGSRFTFSARSRLDTPIDVRYYQNGGILHTVLRDLLHKSAKN
ncbi:MAG: hypothetical protein V9G09_06880 [Candidatus Nanopelagicales bacterium]